MRVLAAAVVVLMPLSVSAQTRVDGYTRQDGTYVAPHMRSSPNSTQNDNWSVKPNVNPYTGQAGTRNPNAYGGGYNSGGGYGSGVNQFGSGQPKRW